MKELCRELKGLLMDKGASLVGFADLIGVPADVRDSMRFAISMAVALDAAVTSTIQDGPTDPYYIEYRKANALLTGLGKVACSMIEGFGYKAVSKKPTHAGIDPKTQSTALPHKTVATRAGLGWIGKCALLVTEEYGSAIRISTVLTDAPLEASAPVDDSLCGDCTLCVESCPGKAPSGKNWKVGLHRDSFFDVFACERAARERGMTKLGIDDTICGICISICPWTIGYIEREPGV
ncbi:MAG: 4Fe-4S double cluster binding domain-containing protein [Candidatus Zixiibacteriota bacterium]